MFQESFSFVWGRIGGGTGTLGARPFQNHLGIAISLDKRVWNHYYWYQMATAKLFRL